MMPLEDYQKRYRHVRLDREDGVLTVTLHSDGGPIVWGKEPHEELGRCFGDIADDLENEIVIITGAGDQFIGAMDFPPIDCIPAGRYIPLQYDAVKLLNNLLSIPVPVIGAINGPARVHAELGLLSDIVIASDNALFQDAPHFPAGLVPGDGVHVIWPLLLGPNRGRYFLLMGEEINATEALRVGLVGETMSQAELLPRARAIAASLMTRPALTRRHTRALLVRRFQRQLMDELTLGIALEGLAWSEFNPNSLRIRSDAKEAHHV